MIDLCPTKCNICGGSVYYIRNAKIYNKSYGSGFCYQCSNCKAYVGTHKDNPEIALGLLANKRMRELKVKAHKLFDKRWTNSKERKQLYYWLSQKLNIPFEECHFGYMNEKMLEKAIKLLESESE